VETCGNAAADGAISAILELHDRLTGGDPGMELA